MKFVKKSLISNATLMFFLFLTACAGQQEKDSNATTDKAPALVATKQFLPVRQYDKENKIIPFVPSTNPYEAIKGKIDKTSVVEFIAARKDFNNQLLDKAESRFKNITENDKSLAGPWVYLGHIELKKNAIDSAISHFRKAIEVNPLNVNAYLPLALAYRKQGKFVLAQNTYANALNQWQDFPEAHLNLAILYDLYLNDPLQAQQHMEAYQFLTQNKDETVKTWLQELQNRTGIEPNLYIGPPIRSQNSQ